MKSEELSFLNKLGVDINQLALLHGTPDVVHEYLVEKIRSICSELEENSNLYSAMNEDDISSTITQMLNQNSFITATREQNSRGHVDITITFPSILSSHNYKCKGEAKIWGGYERAVEGFEQIDGYSTGRQKNSFLIYYFQIMTCDTIFNEYIFKLKDEGKVHEILDSQSRYSKTSHSHPSSAILILDHYAAHFPTKK